MAIIQSDWGISIVGGNGLFLNELMWRDGRWEYDDNQPVRLNGIPYPDTYRVVWWHDRYLTDLLGKGITVDLSTGDITGGTISGVVHATAIHGDWRLDWDIQGLSLSAKDVYEAALTPLPDDDNRLLAKALSGADSFILSDRLDSAVGFGGKDRMEGNGGNDWLRGGGADQILGGLGEDWLYGDEGHDTLTGGLGRDVFVYDTLKACGDTIADYDSQDGFQVREKKFGLPRHISGQLSAEECQVSADSQALDAAVRFIFCTTDSTLWFDSNGSADGGLRLIADLQDGAQFDFFDIMLI